MKDRIAVIRALEDKYGMALFRMALSHLIDVGTRHLTDENAVAEDIKQIMAQGEADRANGVHSVMTPEFQCEIIRCAAELAQFSVWTLIAFISAGGVYV